MNEQQIPQSNSAQELYKTLQTKATLIRNHIIDMITSAKSAHMGCALSISDILAVLYHCFIDAKLIKQQSLHRNYVILSKGHAASALYAALAVEGLIPTETLKTYYQDASLLLGHPVRNNLPGIEASTGSLGHGLPMGVGLALAAKHDQRKSQVYVILGDGECQEGTIWESVILATRFQLDNLTMIIDYNNLQGLDLTDDLVPGGYSDKFKGFGCPPLNINGHNHQELITALKAPHLLKMPKVIIARTCKGKGISFIENKLEWHYKSFNPEQYDLAKKDLS